MCDRLSEEREATIRSSWAGYASVTEIWAEVDALREDKKSLEAELRAARRDAGSLVAFKECEEHVATIGRLMLALNRVGPVLDWIDSQGQLGASVVAQVRPIVQYALKTTEKEAQ